jgi:hypothetical protein
MRPSAIPSSRPGHRRQATSAGTSSLTPLTGPAWSNSPSARRRRPTSPMRSNDGSIIWGMGTSFMAGCGGRVAAGSPRPQSGGRRKELEGRLFA